MKNLPIKKEIEKLLKEEATYKEGVWKIAGKECYLKSTSEIICPPVRIPIKRYHKNKKAVKDVFKCAKVYQVLIKRGMYHPKTQIVVYKDNENNLALMVLMPELEINHFESKNKVIEKIRELKLENKISYDMTLGFNWGYDKKTGKFYAHDLHIREKTSDILKLADELGVG